MLTVKRKAVPWGVIRNCLFISGFLTVIMSAPFLTIVWAGKQFHHLASHTGLFPSGEFKILSVCLQTVWFCDYLLVFQGLWASWTNRTVWFSFIIPLHRTLPQRRQPKNSFTYKLRLTNVSPCFESSVSSTNNILIRTNTVKNETILMSDLSSDDIIPCKVRLTKCAAIMGKLLWNWIEDSIRRPRNKTQ